jgi:hypothetical protein
MDAHISEKIHRRWKRDSQPLRKLVLWGWDSSNEPSFAILYGYQTLSGEILHLSEKNIADFIHSLKKNKKNMLSVTPEIEPGDYYVLEDEVKYVGYLFLHGNKGHFSSFKPVQFKSFTYFDWRKRTPISKGPFLVEKNKRYRGGYYSPRHNFEDREVENFHRFTEVLKLPYFSIHSQENIVQLIKDQNVSLEGFTLATSAQEVLTLKKENAQYLDDLIEIMTNQRIYMRKKRLALLIKQDPPKEIFDLILELGSSELVAGLFLELAQQKNEILLETAKNLVKSELSFA